MNNMVELTKNYNIRAMPASTRSIFLIIAILESKQCSMSELIYRTKKSQATIYRLIDQCNCIMNYYEIKRFEHGFKLVERTDTGALYE